MPEPVAKSTLTRQPRLLDRVRAALRARHYSKRTEQAYIQWIKRYIYNHIRTVQELLGHEDVNTTMVYTHVLNKGGMGVRSPADFLGNDFIRPDKPFAALPPALEQQFRETVNARYNGDLAAAILAFLNLHGKASR